MRRNRWGRRPWANVDDGTNAIVVTLDSHGTILSFHDPFQRLTGYRPEEVVGRSWLDTFIPKGDREEIKELLFEIWRDIDLYEGNENPILTKDGRQLLMRWSNVRLMDNDIDPFNPHGRIFAIGAVGYDITDDEGREGSAS